MRLWLLEAPRDRRGLLGQLWPGATLAQLCAWLAPALDVDLYASEGDCAPVRVLERDDWRDVEAMSLVQRLYPEPDALATDPTSLTYASHLALGMRPVVEDDGTNVGRGTITTPFADEDLKGRVHAAGATVVGGLRSQPLGIFMGVLVARPENAARTLATPVASAQAFRRWAEQQRDILTVRWGHVRDRLIPCAAIVHACGADTGSLPVAIVDDVPVNIAELSILVRDWPVAHLLQSRPRRLLLKHVAIMEGQATGSTMLNGGHGWDSWGAWRNRSDYPTFRRLGPEYSALTEGYPERHANHLWPVIAEAVARAWGTTLGELVTKGMNRWTHIVVGDLDDPPTWTLVLSR